MVQFDIFIARLRCTGQDEIRGGPGLNLGIDTGSFHTGNNQSMMEYLTPIPDVTNTKPFY